MLATALLAAGLASTSAFGEPPRYRVEPIVGVVGPSAINEAGSIVGTNLSPMRAWVAHEGRPAELLPLPSGAASSWATDINDQGIVVGATSPSASPEFGGRATAWVPLAGGGYSVHVLGVLPGHATSNATALNNLGDIVGFSSNGTYRFAALFSLAAPPMSLAATGIFDPQDVNDVRTVVDRSFTTKLLDLDTMKIRDLGVPGPGYLASTGVAINVHGEVAGVLIRASTTCDREAARHVDGIGWEPLSTCRAHNGAQDINDLGDVVMTIVLWPYLRIDGEGTHLIDDLVEEEVGVWSTYILAPLSINDARQIATNASNPTRGFSGAVRLTPIIDEDLDGDGVIGPLDLSMLLATWGPCPACPADLDGDGVVGSADLALLLAAWSGGKSA